MNRYISASFDTDSTKITEIVAKSVSNRAVCLIAGLRKYFGQYNADANLKIVDYPMPHDHPMPPLRMRISVNLSLA